MPGINSIRRRKERRKWIGIIDSQKTIKLEFGAGGRRGSDGWTTVDLGGADITYDVTLGIPLPDECVAQIYSSHLLEHLNFDQILNFLLECKRVLSPNGTIRSAVPDSRLYLNAYMNEVNFKPISKMHAPAVWDTGSLIDQLNYIAYMGGEHKYLFDEENLLNIFKKVGFSQVLIDDFKDGIDLIDRKDESIYCEAIK